MWKRERPVALILLGRESLIDILNYNVSGHIAMCRNYSAYQRRLSAGSGI